MSILTDRELEFLTQSNLIENISNIDYSIDENSLEDQGHVGAYFESQRLAKSKQPLTELHLCRWQGLIAREQLRFGHELPPSGVGVLRGPQCPLNVTVGTHVAPGYELVGGLMGNFLQELNAALASVQPATVDVAILLGDYFQRFESIHPFVDGNGRTGRLIANFITTRAGLPILVFRLLERAEYYAAHSSTMAMRRFMAGKLREATFDARGALFLRSGGDGATDRYKGPRGQVLLVENHDLTAAVEKWR